MVEFPSGLTNKTTAKTLEQPIPSIIDQLIADKKQVVEYLLSLKEKELFEFLGKDIRNKKEAGEVEVERADPTIKDIINGELSKLTTKNLSESYLLRIGAYKKEKGI